MSSSSSRRGQVAGSVSLSAHLVLARTSQPRDNQVAYLRGARIHSSSPFSLRLEGNAGRFPTEAVSFSELGFGNAPWTVTCAYEELSDGFMGRIRLLINIEHPVGRLALEPTAPPWIGRMLHGRHASAHRRGSWTGRGRRRLILR